MLWIFLSVLIWGLFHSLLASLKAKQIVRGWLGERFMRFYRLAYNLFAVLSFLPVLALLVLLPGRRLYMVPLPWSILMILGELVGGIAILVGFQQTDAWEFIGLRQLSAGPGESPGRLVTSGLYRYMRHPLYSAGLLILWLFPLMTTGVLALDLGLTLYIIVGAAFEERKLRREYGPAYAEYSARTPMFIPFTKWNKK